MLRSVKFSEQDKIVTLFTKEQGKVVVIAKGAQNARSKFLSSTQPFSYCEYLLNKKNTYAYIESATLVKSFKNISLSIDKIASASYISELVDKMYEYEQEDMSVLSLLYYTLHLIEKEDDTSSLLLGLMFTLKIMGLYGISPHLTSCTECNKTYPMYSFDFGGGGLLCRNCKTEELSMKKITNEQANLLYNLLYLDIAKVTTLKEVEPQTMKYLIRLLNEYLKYNNIKSINSCNLLCSL